MTEPAIQDRMSQNRCFGCGPEVEGGLRLKSRWAEPGRSAVSEWTPSSLHAAGPPDVLNGGIISTLIDCHGICTAVAERHLRAGRPMGEGEPIWCVTARLEVDFKKPTPLFAPVRLVSRVESVEGRKTRVRVELSSGGEITAAGLVLAVEVPAAFLSGHGR